MDLVSLGIDLAVVAGIIALTQVFKSLDKAGKLSRFYVLVPLVLGVVAAFFVTSPLTWQGVGKNALIYAGVSSYLYVARQKLTLAGVPIEPVALAAGQGEAGKDSSATAGPDGPIEGR
jgi:hypothetical protein